MTLPFSVTTAPSPPASTAHRLRRPAPTPEAGAARKPARRPLGQVLLDSGALAPGDLLKALAIGARQQSRIGDVLLAHGMVSQAALTEALATQWHAETIDPAADPPDPRLIDMLGPAECLTHGLLPWRRCGGVTVIASAWPEKFEAMRVRLTALYGPVALALVEQHALQAAICSMRRTALTERAETRVPEAQSCRGSRLTAMQRALALLFSALLCGALLAPQALFVLLVGWAVLTLVLTTGLKLAAAAAVLRDWSRPAQRTGWDSAAPAIARYPVISILVPLFGEDDIAGRLISRLGRLTYPKELLDVILVVEEDDAATRHAVSRTRLPHWMRVITVPASTLKTKPRALNFALDFCRGSIVGIYDAEDAPDPDQLHRVARRFHERGSELACVQGTLDYYNPRSNWLARCFTVEYATWFRIVLPGMERLGLAVPLGGTTLFVRRDVLESLGAWDSHNVTEDADLGIRLARAGYRTELLDTVTAEEANCRVLPWIRQRSRWLKGYAITYAVHMRDPRRLLADLGWWRLFGVQVLFLATLSQFVLTPVLWSFWLMLLGLGHPLLGVLEPWVFFALAALFLTSEVVSLGVGLLALSRRRHRFLRPWLPTMHFYFPLAALAVYKALWELLTRPYYWDKTAHGLFAGDRRTGVSALPLAPTGSDGR